jgi:hypothetical protein
MISPAILLQAAQAMGKFQKNPEQILEYIPNVNAAFGLIFELAEKEYPDANHLAIMFDERAGQILVHLVDISEDSKITSISKIYMAEFLAQLDVPNLPEVLSLIKKRESWSIISKSLFKPKAQPVTTFEEEMIYMAKPDDQQRGGSENDIESFERLKPTLANEFNSGDCYTLKKLLENHYSQSDIMSLLNMLKLDAKWSVEFHAEMCWDLWVGNDYTLTEIDRIWSENNSEPIRDE